MDDVGISNVVKINRALISVYYKDGLDDLIAGLFNINSDIHILSSGGTAKAIRELGFFDGDQIQDVSDYTGFPESPQGLLKTIHPKIEGGLLLDPDFTPDVYGHGKYMKENDIKGIDLVVVNLYPFITEVEGKTIEGARHLIDIGGPTMLRAAAKNFRRITVLVDPKDYITATESMKENGGGLTFKERFEYAVKAFQHTANYDTAIANHLKGLDPEEVSDFYFI